MRGGSPQASRQTRTRRPSGTRPGPPVEHFRLSEKSGLVCRRKSARSASRPRSGARSESRSIGRWSRRGSRQPLLAKVQAIASGWVAPRGRRSLRQRRRPRPIRRRPNKFVPPEGRLRTVLHQAARRGRQGLRRQDGGPLFDPQQIATELRLRTLPNAGQGNFFPLAFEGATGGQVRANTVRARMRQSVQQNPNAQCVRVLTQADRVGFDRDRAWITDAQARLVAVACAMDIFSVFQKLVHSIHLSW